VTRAVLEDHRTSAVRPELKATLAFLEKMTHQPGQLGPADAEAVLAAGVSRAALQDAVHVCFAFNVLTRVADALDFDIPSDEAFRSQARMLMSRGYRLG
jgi:alkylhydroperoxidase family enzyme